MPLLKLQTSSPKTEKQAELFEKISLIMLALYFVSYHFKQAVDFLQQINTRQGNVTTSAKKKQNGIIA